MEFKELAVAIVPSIVIIIIVLLHDRYEKEPVWLLCALFVLGIVSIAPSVLLETLYEYAFPEQTVRDTIITCFLGIALVEEGCKYVALLFAYKKPSFNEVYDGIIYSVMVSLGFATVENIMYVFSYGIGTGMIRAITSVPGHAVFAMIMGYFVSMSKVHPNRKSFYRMLSLLSATFVHGLYDSLLMVGADLALLAFIPLMIVMYVLAYRLIKKTNRLEPFQ